MLIRDSFINLNQWVNAKGIYLLLFSRPTIQNSSQAGVEDLIFQPNGQHGQGVSNTSITPINTHNFNKGTNGSYSQLRPSGILRTLEIRSPALKSTLSLRRSKNVCYPYILDTNKPSRKQF